MQAYLVALHVSFQIGAVCHIGLVQLEQILLNVLARHAEQGTQDVAVTRLDARQAAKPCATNEVQKHRFHRVVAMVSHTDDGQQECRLPQVPGAPLQTTHNAIHVQPSLCSPCAAGRTHGCRNGPCGAVSAVQHKRTRKKPRPDQTRPRADGSYNGLHGLGIHVRATTRARRHYLHLRLMQQGISRCLQAVYDGLYIYEPYST